MSESSAQQRVKTCKPVRTKCELNELAQYQCEVGKTHIECIPFVRLFYKCAGMPMLEVTPQYGSSLKNE
ncbi:hypothetical protein DM01DRAFT_1118830 [Hesseltinella vesiculosa]|uniref:Uncharacterized protein n=1 Tax=Hesseltinella vesiculosa TaxID=101127 RepID=A0A1X2GTC0_9FUNG|nr:hypothetical protein DM01DRAFT_1118830 [Hesseltinella vesiculosa]